MARLFAELRPGQEIRHQGRHVEVTGAPVELGNGMVSIEVRDIATRKIRTIRAARDSAPRITKY